VSRNVVLLGAGASARAGVPLLKDFLRTANTIRISGSLSEEDRALFDLVFRARDALTTINSKSRLDFDNFEEIYSAFDMASLIGRLGDLDEKSVLNLPSAMSRVITVTIEKSTKLPVSGDIQNQKVLPPLPYDHFVKTIMPYIRGGQISILSFNYDLAIDYALYFNGVGFDYGFGVPPNTSRKMDLLKLHGSLNWGRCSGQTCKKIVIWSLEDYFKQFRWSPFIDVDEVRLELASKLCSRTHCHPETLEIDPVLIPPTWNKGGFHRELSGVWGKAAHHLAEAENIYVIGYSFPASDQFFKYFFAVGSVGRGWIEKIRVVDPDPNGEVEQRFRLLFGPLALSKFALKKVKFEDIAGNILNESD
jgi:hypothetical protein